MNDITKIKLYALDHQKNSCIIAETPYVFENTKQLIDLYFGQNMDCVHNAIVGDYIDAFIAVSADKDIIEIVKALKDSKDTNIAYANAEEVLKPEIIYAIISKKGGNVNILGRPTEFNEEKWSKDVTKGLYQTDRSGEFKSITPQDILEIGTYSSGQESVRHTDKNGIPNSLRGVPLSRIFIGEPPIRKKSDEYIIA